MNSFHISGLQEQPKAIECSVQVLGDPRLSDPAVAEGMPVLEELVAVSPNGEWMALLRRTSFRDEFYTISRTGEGAEEAVVPFQAGWEHARARGIADNGMFLFQAELVGSFSDYGFSQRPIVFTPGDKDFVVLPPEYKEREFGFSERKDNRPKSHAAHCYAPDGTVFGWTHLDHDQKREITSHETSHCIWRREPPGEWIVEYMPKCMDSKWLWPAYDGTFVWCDQPNDDSVVHFGTFNGTDMATYEDISVTGSSTKIRSVARNGVMIGSLSIRDGRHGTGEDEKKKSSFYAFLIQSQTKAGYVFNGLVENPYLEELSPNGQYIIGSHPGIGHFLMKAEDDGYRYAALKAQNWRIENVVDVTDDGHVFALATCTERKHSCFRLKLPVLLIPKW